VTSLTPILSLFADAGRAVALQVTRFHARRLRPTAPTAMVLEHALRMANLERRRA